MTVSVAMAAYNGGRFIEEQINSILPQLSENDELVVSLDPSEDNTLEIIQGHTEKHPNVRLVNGLGKGVIKNFQNAVKNCSGDIIFLCDQDDVWCENKVERVKKEFSEKNISLVMHDAKIVDTQLNVLKLSFFEEHGTKTGIVKNIIRNSYIGCCMAFKKELCEFIMPFPDNLPMHDQWIGLTAERHGGVSLINEPLILYRRHGDNVTSDSHSGIKDMISWRFAIIKDLLKG